MPDICVITAEEALANAIAEQFALALPTETRVFKDLLTVRIMDETAVIILDEALIDKKLPRALRTAAASKNIPLFLIGEREKIDDELIAETFEKPLRLGHLLARLQFHMQATKRAPGSAIAFGPWTLDAHMRKLTNGESGDVVRLTEKETSLLEYLGQSASPVSREELLAAIWGYDARIDTHTLETHIYRLRRKLDPQGEGRNIIISQEGAYRLSA